MNNSGKSKHLVSNLIFFSRFTSKNLTRDFINKRFDAKNFKVAKNSDFLFNFY